MLIGIDTGGTFTDFVLWDGASLRVHKALSTPEAPEQAILQGLRDLGLNTVSELRLVHGSTVATNAALEGKGVRTVYIGNRGLGDLLTIGRQARRELYNLEPPPVTPPVPAELCLEADTRLAADGSQLHPLDPVEIRRLVEEVKRLAPRSVAINLLFSYLDDQAERALAEALPSDLFVSLSSQVLPEIREYERGMATWLNGWVGPLVEGYLRRLALGTPGIGVSVMQSSGDTITAERAGSQAVRMLLSGPAGGLAGARFVAAASGLTRLLTFDMGGTSTDVALIDGEPTLTREGRIGPWPVAVPMVEMDTIGAGGGSIAFIDGGGMLQVGPHSAGASPGPACYGLGGTRPTVTDANLLLGRLRPDAFLGGRMRLDPMAAQRAVAPLAQVLGVAIETAAEGIIRLANEHMARALRVISVQRGIDPRECILTSFGGAGGLHVCALADALGMRQALVPVHGGVLSALGMLAAAPGRQLSRTRLSPLEKLAESALEGELQALAAEGRRALEQEGIGPEEIRVEFGLDLRYQGQSSTLSVPWRGTAQSREAFEALHERRFGHRLETEVELVNLRAAVRGLPAPLSLSPLRSEEPTPPPGWGRLYGVADSVAIYARHGLMPGQRLIGPALVTEEVATTWLEPGWTAQVEANGNLLLSRG